MEIHRPRRSGLSLVELLVVVTMLGLFASVAMMRFGRNTFSDTGARSEARLASLALIHAQRSAIRTGDSHGLVIQGSSADAVRWSVVKQTNGRQEVVEGPHDVAAGVTLSANRQEIWFNFEGVVASPFQLQIIGANRAYELTVEQLTGMVRTQEINR